MSAIISSLGSIGKNMLEKLRNARIMVVGDFMLDVYTFGNVRRISPEAPVPVLCVDGEKQLPGGAGNVILNMVSLGMEVVAIGRVGKDDAGGHFIESLKQESVNVHGVLVDSHFSTPKKNRMIADNQQLLRVDQEKVSPLSEENMLKMMRSIETLLDGVEVIAISDYAKGFLTRPFLKELIALSKQRSIPLIVDPKGMDFTKYRGAYLIKPNLGEMIAASGLDPETPLETMAEKIMRDTEIESLMVTRSKEGISLFQKDKERRDFPARVHEVKDVTGAGDTVLSIITAAIAAGLDLGDAAVLANLGAGIAIERVGCARISRADLAHRLERLKTVSV